MKLFAAFLILAANVWGADPQVDLKAKQIAESMMSAMGGPEAWMRAHFVRFDFRVSAGGKMVVDRSHLWDKQTGRYRLEMKDKEGRPVTALFNAGDGQGGAYSEGKKIEGQAGTAAVKNAYGAYINDMYWLAMPWKWMDPGVRLKYLGSRSRNGQPFDVIELSFGKVGLTPGDRYHAYVSPRSKLMEFWEYTLQNGQKGAWTWEYVTAEGIKLGSNHVSTDGKTIHMGNVQILNRVDEGTFSDPRKKL